MSKLTKISTIDKNIKSKHVYKNSTITFISISQIYHVNKTWLFMCL